MIPSRGPPRWAVVTVAVLLGGLLAESGVAVITAERSSFGVSVFVSYPFARGLTANFQITTGFSPASFKVGVVPGAFGLARDPTVLVFADPAFHPLYANPNDVYGIGVRVGDYLEWLGTGDKVEFITAAELPKALSDHPMAYLLMVGTGVIPDSVFSNSSAELVRWIQGGGVLIWGGGPLGYLEGHPTSGGFDYSNLYWAGQERLVGFPLTDNSSLSSGPLPTGGIPYPYGQSPSSLAQALGLSYSATIDGANVSELTSHNGVDLGYISAAETGGTYLTSLAWTPVMKGGVFYFGGAVYSPTYGYVPDASVELSDDIALLISTGYLPAPGLAASGNVTIGPLSEGAVSLTVPDRTLGEVGLVRSEADGSLFYAWHTTLCTPEIVPA